MSRQTGIHKHVQHLHIISFARIHNIYTQLQHIAKKNNQKRIAKVILLTGIHAELTRTYESFPHTTGHALNDIEL